MSIPYSAFYLGITMPAERKFREAVVVATQTFRRSSRRSSIIHKAGKALARAFAAVGRRMHGSGTAADAYAVRHARDVESLTRMARSLETSQPALAAELMLLACR